ncbi:MAG TPA: class I SAM-dependent methyltransferase [Pirellulaceae bacterium]|nr:class I SAM-dependent methyltransferase [Pirellulaceae bacterium]
MSDILEYYARRAADYDRIYEKPERQDDLRRLESLLVEWLAGRNVLEVACGTGYWTAKLAPHVNSMLATDKVSEVLAVARQRCRQLGNIRFELGDACDARQLSNLSSSSSGRVGNLSYNGGLAAFFWSHVKKQELAQFLASLRSALAPRAHVALCDSRFVPGSSTPISRNDPDGNSYQSRRLADGTQHEILKNFPSSEEIRLVLAAAGIDRVEVTELTYFWCARYIA